MNGKHFEIGTIQAFLDGETTPEVSVRLTDHVAGCDSCARLLSTAEEESSFVFSALERELNTLVPSQRLWSRINESIAVEHRPTFWEKVFVYIRVSLASPSITAAAGIILVAGIFAILWMPKSPTTGVADKPLVASTASTAPAGPVEVAPVENPIAPVSASTDGTAKKGTTYVEVSNLSPKRLQAITADLKLPPQTVAPQYAGYLPGEESYLRTIADLKENVDSQKDTVLTPATRVAYERDMAVVNDSIKRMREVIQRNPRNQAARQVLYSSYQDKIDLLNSVAQREELMATVR